MTQHLGPYPVGLAGEYQCNTIATIAPGVPRRFLMEPPVFDPLDREAFTNPTLQRLWFFIYLLPIFGLIPALWQLSQRRGDRAGRQVSRLAVLTALIWLLGYGLLNSAAAATETQALAHGLLLLANSGWSSGYFLLNLWLMVRLWRRQPLTVPLLSRLTKYLP